MAGSENYVAKAREILRAEERAEIVHRKSLPRERRRLRRERLHVPGRLARHVGGGHAALFDGPQRLAGHAVEHPYESLLADLRHGVDGLAVVMHGEEFRGGGVVVVPNVVVDELEMPEALAGAGVEREEAVAEEIGAEAVCAVEIVLGAGGGRVEDAAFGVERHFAPDVGAADGLPRVLRPRLVAELAGMRDGVKGPGQLAGARVEGAYVAGRRSGSLIGRRPQD